MKGCAKISRRQKCGVKFHIPRQAAARKNSWPVSPRSAILRYAVRKKAKRHVGDMTLCFCESSVVGDHVPQGRALA
jgi:hypothetical protein